MEFIKYYGIWFMNNDTNYLKVKLNIFLLPIYNQYGDHYCAIYILKDKKFH